MGKGRKQLHILCLRFSALGDVAIASVVLKTCARDYPEVEFTLAGPGLLAPLFEGLPNLRMLPVDKGQPLLQIMKILARTQPTHIADLHSVVRSFFLRTLFFFRGVPVSYLHKGRQARRRLLKDPTGSPSLIPMYRRYAVTLGRLGFEALSLSDANIISLERGPLKKVGIAPFARHRGKQWPLDKMRRVANRIASGGGQVFLFGGGEEEVRLMESWTKDNDRIVLAVQPGKGFEAELAVIRTLDVMISMDSANMHFASALGIPVVSVWGATHPKAGFYGWRQDPSRAVQLPMECRPCSVFGAKPCRKRTYACMEELTEEKVLCHVGYE